MRSIPSIAVGLWALWGSVAGADELPVVKETNVSHGGCLYRFQVLDDSASGSPNDYPSAPPWQLHSRYQLVVRSEAESVSCGAAPGPFVVSRGFEVPDLTIQANHAGLVVAYTRGVYHPWLGQLRVLDVDQLDPATLTRVRSLNFVARYGRTMFDYAAGKLSLGQLSLEGQSIELVGGLAGNTVWGGGSSQTGNGRGFHIRAPDFLSGSIAAPDIVIY